MSTTPIVLTLTLDASDVQAALQGKVVPAVDQAIKDILGGTEQVNKAVEGVGQELDNQAHKAEMFGKRGSEAFYNAEMSIRTLNQSLGLGLGRHMEVILAMMPMVQKAMQAAFQPMMILFAAEAIFKVGEALYKAHEKAAEAAKKYEESVLKDVGAIQQEALATEAQNAELDQQIARLEGEPTNNLQVALLHAAEKAHELTRELADFDDKLDEVIAKTQHWYDTFNLIKIPVPKGMEALISGPEAEIAKLRKAQADMNKDYEKQLLLATSDQEKRNISIRQATDDVYALANAQLNLSNALNTMHAGGYSEDQIRGMESAVRMVENELKVAQDKLAGIDKGQSKAALEQKAEDSRKAAALSKAEIEGTKNLALERIKTQQDADKTLYENHAISLEEYVKAQAAAENKRFIATSTANARLIDLARASKAPDRDAQVKALQDKQLVDAEAYQAALTRIYSKGGMDRVALDLKTTEEQISAQKRLDVAVAGGGRITSLEAEQKAANALVAAYIVAGKSQEEIQKVKGDAAVADANLANAQRERSNQTTQEIIKNEEQVAQVRKTQAEEAIKSAASMHMMSPAGETAALIEEENKYYELRKKNLQSEVALYSKGTEDEKKLAIQKALELEGVEAQHAATLQAMRDQGRAKELDAQAKFWQESASRERAAIDFEFEVQKEAIDLRVALGEESRRKAIQEELVIEEQRYDRERNLLNQQLIHEIQTYHMETEEYKKLLDERSKLDKDYALKKKKLDDELTIENNKYWMAFRDESSREITQAIMGQESWKKAVERIYDDMLSMAIQNGVKWLEQEALNLAKKYILHKAVSSATSLQDIMNAAAVGAANAEAATAAIPIVGPEMAPAVGAATFADIMSWSAVLTAATGALIPRSGFIMAHEAEAVLPARLTNLLMGVANRPGGISNSSTSIGGATTLNVTQNIHGGNMSPRAMGQASVDAFQTYVRRQNLQIA
jgi:hypothetical protein